MNGKPAPAPAEKRGQEGPESNVPSGRPFPNARGTRRSRRRRVGRPRLDSRLRAMMARDPETVSVATCRRGGVADLCGVTPDADWPIFLATRADGLSAYVLPMPRAVLERDPTLSGRRPDVERDCLSRGAGFEVWTEFETDMDLTVPQLVRPATAAERSSWVGAAPESHVAPRVVRTLVARLGIRHVRPVGDGWAGRCALTGILMALLCDLVPDPGTRLLVWRPRMPTEAVGDRATLSEGPGD